MKKSKEPDLCEGKGNRGRYIDRCPKICAAGLPTAQPNDFVAASLEHYLLKDKVDALISDVILPPEKPRPLPPLRHPIPLDMRYAGPYGHVSQLINPPPKTKFQNLVEELKTTSYTSYWHKPLGAVKDPAPMLPAGFDIYSTCGKKPAFHDPLYDVVMPKEPPIDKTPISKYPGVQKNRKYCEPSFDPDRIYGYRADVDKRGRFVKCCLTDDDIFNGTGWHTIYGAIQSKHKNENEPQIGKELAPNNNISCVPEGHVFGIQSSPDNLPECLSYCQLNEERLFFKECLSHLNTLRKCLSTRLLPSFFYEFYFSLKYLDTDRKNWLPKDTIYNMCSLKYIRFNPHFIEPLLRLLGILIDNEIEYKSFVDIINYREPYTNLPRILDMPVDCLDFRTTYTEMTKPEQLVDNRHLAGLPSARYLDLDYPITPNYYCKADRITLPQENDMNSCLSPSVFTLLNVNHRDMYANRDPQTVRMIFEAAGEHFEDNKFNDIWEEAKKYHSKGWVCYETFRRALLNMTAQDNKNKK